MSSAICVCVKSIEASSVSMSEAGKNDAYVILSLGDKWTLTTSVKQTDSSIAGTWNISTGGAFTLTKEYAVKNAMIISLKNKDYINENLDTLLGNAEISLFEQFSRVIDDVMISLPVGPEEVQLSVPLMSPATGSFRLNLLVTREVVAPASGFIIVNETGKRW